MNGIGTMCRRLLPLLAVAGVMSLGTASSAQATTAHYCEGATLPAQWVCAGAMGCCHPYVQIHTDHTGCAGWGVGYGGYSSNPTDYYYTTAIACTDGAGAAGGSFYNDGGVWYHGAVKNRNQSTGDYISEAHMTW
jgi:hypothetical protein